MFCLIFLLSTIFSTSFAQLLLPQCPQLKPIANFNATKYGGNWFEIQRAHNNYDKNNRCSVIKITSSNASIRGLNPVDGSYSRIYASGEQRGNTSVFDFQYPLGAPRDFGVMTILVINYNRFAVKIISEPQKYGPCKVYVWILSRTRTISSGDYQCAIDALLENNLPTETLENVDQWNCPDGL